MINKTMRHLKTKQKTFYRACIATTSVIQGTSRKRLYRELGLESLTDRYWTRKLVFL